MLCCTSPEEVQSQAITKRTNEKLEQDKDYSTIKILLLGSGESGKSTFFKQLRLIFCRGWTDMEKKIFIRVMHVNVIQSMQQLIAAAEYFNKPVNKEYASIVKSVVLRGQTDFVGLETNVEIKINRSVTGIQSSYTSKELLQTKIEAMQNANGNEVKNPLFKNPNVNTNNNNIPVDVAISPSVAAQPIPATVKAEPMFVAGAIVLPACNEKNILTKQVAEAIDYLWKNDKGIKFTYDNRHLFQLQDTCSYFFDHVLTLAQPDYLPEAQDIINSRIRTVGVSQLNLKHNATQFSFIDIGGQRSERKKWMNYFSDATTIIFFVSLSEYDQSLLEDPTQNRMHESLNLFDRIINIPTFARTPIILFFNKRDLFELKIKNKSISCCFPDYKGGPNDFAASVKFIQKKFTELDKSEPGTRSIFPYVVIAINTPYIAKVFESVEKVLIKTNCNMIGIM